MARWGDGNFQYYGIQLGPIFKYRFFDLNAKERMCENTMAKE